MTGCRRSFAAFSLSLLLAASASYAQAQCPVRPRCAEPLYQRTYAVPDLVIPVHDADVTVPKNSSSWSADSPGPTGAAEAPRTQEVLLMQLIADTVAPESWVERGGPASMDYFPLGMCLVVEQTKKNHERIVELLESLRRQQQVEVALEVRFVTLAEPLYQQLTTKPRQCPPANQLNVFVPTDFCSGLLAVPSESQNAGAAFTSDLAYPVQPAGCGQPARPCGSCANAAAHSAPPAALAFLDDHQVCELLEAVQAEKGSNVLQAPKLTLMNGQASTLDLTDRQLFLTGVNFAEVHGQSICTPRQEPVQTGWQVAAQPVISADRRYVRLHVKVNHDELAVTPVPMMPVTTFVEPVFEGGAVGQPVPFTQFVQQPKINRQLIEKTVSVPDGQTIVLDAGQVVQQHRTESCPLVLGAIPYVNRLFKTVALCETTEHTLVLITPRIVVSEEEEIRPPAACPASQPQPVAQTSPAPKSEVIQASHLELVPPQRTEHAADRPCVKSERATKVMPPICEGAAACEEAPDEAEVLRALPHPQRSAPYLYESSRDDVQVVTERIVDKIDPARYYPLIGPASLHHCHWKCTVYYTETIQGSFPFPFKCVRPRVEVVYIDKDHLHVCADTRAGGAPAAEEHCCAVGHCPVAASGCEACSKAKVAELLKAYEQACTAGELDSAARLAVQALAVDPACFSKAHRPGAACAHAKPPIPW
jgi:hypothetical protein